MSQPPKNDSS